MTGGNLRYKCFAYFVIRDALGFYFGIPKFLSTCDLNQVIEEKLDKKIKNQTLSVEQINKHRRLITKSVQKRVDSLREDYQNCQDTLFTDNLWLQWLGIDPEFFKRYVKTVSVTAIEELAIVPTWNRRDDLLRRPYLSSDKIKFE